MNGEWIPPPRVLSKLLHKAFKPAFKYLVNLEIRLKLGISPNNDFLFTNKHCKANISIRSRFEKTCVESGLEHMLKATDVRQCVSTFLTEDMTDDEREVFFKFMGHSRDISKNVYSCRPAL